MALSVKKKTKREQKISNNLQCTYCRKCYNSGLCMMPWPGIPTSAKAEWVERDNAFRKAKPARP